MALSLLILFIPLNTFADGDDLTNVLNVLTQIYGVENQSLPASLQQLQNLNNSISNNLSGNFGYGNYLNTQNDLNQMQWSNSSWQDVLNLVGGGNTQQFAAAQQAYANLYPTVNSNQIGQTLTNNDLTRIQYQQANNINRAALAASSYSYNDINTHLQNIHNMLSMLESQPSEKAAVDLNTRLVAEISFIQLEMLKQQDIQTQILATNSQGNVNSLSDQSKFNQWNPPQ